MRKGLGVWLNTAAIFLQLFQLFSLSFQFVLIGLNLLIQVRLFVLQRLNSIADQCSRSEPHSTVNGVSCAGRTHSAPYDAAGSGPT